MDSSLGQAVGAIAPKNESTRDHSREETSQSKDLSLSSDEFSAQTDESGLPISHGRFELPTELFSVLLQEAQPLMSA